MPRSVVAVIVLYAIDPAQCISLRSLLKATAQLPSGELPPSDPTVRQHTSLPGRHRPRFGICARHCWQLVRHRIVCSRPEQQWTGDGLSPRAARRAQSRIGLAAERWIKTLSSPLTVSPRCCRSWLRPTTVPMLRPSGRNFAPGDALSRRTGLSPGDGRAGFPLATRGCPTRRPSRSTLARCCGLRIASDGRLFALVLARQQRCKHGSPADEAEKARLCRRSGGTGPRLFMHNLQEKVSPRRHETILLAESAFWMEMNALAGLERTLRRAGRLVKQHLRGDNLELRQLTAGALRSRLLHSRRFRIAR